MIQCIIVIPPIQTIYKTSHLERPIYLAQSSNSVHFLSPDCVSCRAPLLILEKMGSNSAETLTYCNAECRMFSVNMNLVADLCCRAGLVDRRIILSICLSIYLSIFLCHYKSIYVYTFPSMNISKDLSIEIL